MSGSESDHETSQKKSDEFPKQGEDLRNIFEQDFSANTNESDSRKPEMGSTSPSFSSKNASSKSATFGESSTLSTSAKSERVHSYACPADCDCGKYGSPNSGKDRQSSPNPNRKLRIEESFSNLGEHARESSEKKYLRFSEYVLRKISVRVIRAAQKGLWRTEIFLTETSWSRDLENQRRLVESLAKQKLLAHVYPAHNRKIRISVKWSPCAQSNLECSQESDSGESDARGEEQEESGHGHSGDSHQRHRHLRRHRASSPYGSESESEIEDDSDEASAIETDFERQEMIARKARKHARRLEKLELIKVREQEEKEKRKALQKLKAKYSQDLSDESTTADETQEDKKKSKKGKKDKKKDKKKKEKKNKKDKKGKKDKKKKKSKKSSSDSESSESSSTEEEILLEVTNKRDTERVSKISGEEGGEKKGHRGYRRGHRHGGFRHRSLDDDSGSDLDLDIWFSGKKGSRSRDGEKERKVCHEMSLLLEGAEKGLRCHHLGDFEDEHEHGSSSRRGHSKKLEGYGDLIESFGGYQRKGYGKARRGGGHFKKGKGFRFESDSDSDFSSSSSSSSSDSD